MVAIVIPRYFNPTLIVSAIGVSIRFVNGAGLAMNFRVERSVTSTPDSCSVNVCNMEPTRAVAMNAAFSALGVSAFTVQGGYDVIAGGLFLGDVRRFTSARRDGADVWTDITGDDSGDAYSDVLLRVSNVAMTAAQMIAVAATAMGLVQAPSVAEVLARSDYTKQGPYTAVMVGKAHELIDAACRRIKCRWFIRDKQIHLVSLGLASSASQAVLITPQSIVGDASVGGSGTVSVPVLFDPNIVPGGQVSYLGALARVERVVHQGQTRGGLWTSQVEGRFL
jgi:hypothetical protein